MTIRAWRCGARAGALLGDDGERGRGAGGAVVAAGRQLTLRPMSVAIAAAMSAGSVVWWSMHRPAW